MELSHIILNLIGGGRMDQFYENIESESNLNESSERVNWELDIHKNLSEPVIDGQLSFVSDNFKSTPQYSNTRKDGIVTFFNGTGKKIASYVLTAFAASIIGGAIVGTAAVLVLPKTDYFNHMISKASATAYTKGGLLGKPALLASEPGELTIPEIAKKVGPAVVGVSSKSITDSTYGFGWPFVPQEQESMGSGIIFSADGYVVTNYHVVDGAQTVKVIFNNGKEVNAKVVNYDATADIAVIKITDNVPMPGIAEFGDSDQVEVGETAVAIGNPLGKDLLGTVTAGIISAKNREIDVDGRKLNLLQTDAAINNGNSGGPLVNSLGQVIGINTVKMEETGVEGLGFAIPINTVKPKIQELIKPILKIGITPQNVTDQIAKQYDLPVGVYVVDVQDFSPAQRAGIKPGDVIVKLAGETVKSVNDINTIKAKYKAGDIIKVEVSRDGGTIDLDMKLIANN